jgi:hypothetical protein
MAKALFTFVDLKYYLFFSSTNSGKQAARLFLDRLKQWTDNRDKGLKFRNLQAQLHVINVWGHEPPADLLGFTLPVLVINGDHDRMVPTTSSYKLAKRLPNAQLHIYENAAHGAIFQHHDDFVKRALAFYAARSGQTPNKKEARPHKKTITMKAFLINKYDKAGGMQLADVPEPVVNDTDVLVTIHAAGLNLLDTKIKAGEFKLILPYKLPLVMGHDVAGVVTQLGNRVKKFKVGDEVYARPADGRIGTFAERIAIDENDVALKPKNSSMVEPASLPLVTLIAWQSLVELAHLKKGKVYLFRPVPVELVLSPSSLPNTWGPKSLPLPVPPVSTP